MRHPAVLPIYPAVALIVLYQDVFITRSGIFTHDSIHWYGNFNYFVLSLAQGSLPLWDPFSFSGSPFYLNNNIVGSIDPTVLITIPLLWIWDLSILDIYHFHFLLRLFILYGGCYALFRYLASNDWAALLGATIVLFVIAPNSFWQHGSTLIITYVPWIALFMLQLISPYTSKNSKGLLFLAICYFLGLSFNMYLPSYIFIYFTSGVIFLFVTRSLKIKHIRDSALAVGIRKGAAGLLLFLVLSGPFLFSATELLPAIAENFVFTRFEESPMSETMVHDTEFTVSGSRHRAQAGFNNFVAMFLPGSDTRYFVPDRLHTSENFLILGLVSLIIIFLFFKRAEGKYKWLFLFLSIFTGLFLFSTQAYETILRLYPSADTIRQMHNFMGLYIISLGGLTAICFGAAFRLLAASTKRPAPSLKWLAFLAVIHSIGIFLYLSFIENKVIERLITDTYLIKTQDLIIPLAWVFVLSYLSVALFLSPLFRNLRIIPACAMVGLILYQLVAFNNDLHPYVIQPAGPAKTGFIHYDREFEYDPIRVPYAPRHANFWGFMAPLYRVPTALPPYFNDYMSLNRRGYDSIRFTSAERQHIISGIGAKRFGFFDQYLVAEDSIDALNIVGRMPIDMLGDTVVLEEDPVNIIADAQSLKRINAQDLPLSDELIRATDQRLIDFYDKSAPVEYDQGTNLTSFGELDIQLASDHPALDWDWNKDSIGRFQIMFGAEDAQSRSYIPMQYFPNPGIRTFPDDSFCYVAYPEWIVKHAIPQFYKQLYDNYPFTCDLALSGNTLTISPELQGTFVSDDVPAHLLQNNISQFTLVSLDPTNVTPDVSRYGRDEVTEVVDFGPNHIQFKIDNRKSGLFYYADTYSKHWNAKVDGTTAHIFQANFAYKAIFVPQGTHVVKFSFYPSVYIYLFWAFIVISIPTALIPVLAYLKTRRIS